jgi:phage virion morphogenesis protein
VSQPVIDIQINAGAINALLDRMEYGGKHMGGAMRIIKREMISLTELAFADEGPGWPGLAGSTIAAREKHGHWPGQILQVSNQLAASVGGESDDDHAIVGEGKVYAAIHQLGGQAGRGHAVEIPARPTLPIDDGGGLMPEAEAVILDEVLAYFARLASA